MKTKKRTTTAAGEREAMLTADSHLNQARILEAGICGILAKEDYFSDSLLIELRSAIDRVIYHRRESFALRTRFDAANKRSTKP